MTLPHTLRGRLVLVLMAASLVGLVLMGVTSAALLNHALYRRVDERLVEMSHPWQDGRRPPPIAPDEHPPDRDVPTDFRVVFFDSSGSEAGMLGQTGSDTSGPLLRDPGSGPEIRTVTDRAGGAPWRVRVIMLPNGNLIALGLSLSSVQATVRQLVMIELAVGAGVLIVLAAAAMVTVRLSLRPLTRIEDTADAIAAGELHRRVPDQDPRTETGRLGTALNTMLERLIDALQQRESSEQRLRRFLADASHELRTPLTSIRGFAELFRRSGSVSTVQARSMMGRIESEAARMGGLVEDMLLLARLDRERGIDTADVDLVPLLGDVVQDARARAPDREITLNTPDSVRALGDSGRLRQVVSNLLTNALLHTTPGTPVAIEAGYGQVGDQAGVVASTGAELPPTAPVTVVVVADQGPAIPTEQARHVFDRFYRATNGHAQGTGLGLAIVAAITEAHDGRVELRHNADGGNSFRLLLPRS